MGEKISDMRRIDREIKSAEIEMNKIQEDLSYSLSDDGCTYEDIDAEYDDKKTKM